MSDPSVDEQRQSDRGPRGWVVLTITVAVLAVVAGGGLAVNRWVIDPDHADEPADTTEVDGSIDVEPVAAPSATRLFVRQTDGGIEIRVHETTDNLFGMPAVDGDTRPGWCQPKSTVMVSALSANAVSQTQLPRTVEPAPEPAVSFGVGGMIEEAPMAMIIAQVDDTVTSARLTHVSGQVDSMEPIDGLVALAIDVPMSDDDDTAPNPAGGPMIAPFQIDTRTIAVEFVHRDGTSDRLTDQQLWNSLPIWTDPQCNNGQSGPGGEQPQPSIPTLELPDPGAEQPDDPALETAAIEQLLEQLYANVDNDATLFSLLDDASGIDLLMHDVLDSEQGDAYLEMDAVVSDIVFFSPIEASFVYTTGLDVYGDGFSGLMPEFGRARLINGVWMITRSTLCQDIAKSGRNCTI